MIKVTFSHATVKRLREELQRAYTRGDLRGVRRLSALILVSEQRDVETVRASWDVSGSTVYAWLKAFLVEGWKSLPYGKMPGRPSRLSKTQKRQLQGWLAQGPEACGYPTGCWTSILIQDLIYQKFHVLYNRFYVCELLRNLGFSRQKACFVSDHLDREARKAWMKEKWPGILALARKIGAPIFFGDETSFALWGSLSYTWAPVGQQPLVKTTGLRKGYKVFGAIEFFSGRLIYQGTEERFNSQTYQTFLLFLLAKVRGPIILIQDGAKYHTSQPTREFFAQHQDRLIVYQLPSYSPDYNPIEFLWKKIKTRATHNRYFEEFVKLVHSVEEALALLATQKEEIKHLMGTYTKQMTNL
jgi:transposase